MSNRVVASPQAVQAAQEMKRILDGNVSDTLQLLRRSGMVLGNPGHWDGPMARDFRSTVWPRSQATMETTLVQLQNMQGWVLKINQDIMRAGSEGGGAPAPAAGSGPSAASTASVTAPIVYDITHLSLRSFYDAAKATFNNLAKLEDHVQRHWTDVGFPWSHGMYAKAANTFLLEAKEAGYEAKVAGQTLRLWDTATKTFAAYTLDGKTRTIFKPGPQSPGDTYWHNPNYGPAATDAELERAMKGAAQALEDAARSPFAKFGQLLDSPLGRLGNRALGALGAAGDVLTILHPSPNALGGANVERWMAVGNLGAMAVTAGPVAGLLAANAGLDWIPGVGEVVMAGTALYFVGDLVYQNREAIGHALSWAGHGIVNVADDVGHGLASGLSHAWHGIFG